LGRIYDFGCEKTRGGCGQSGRGQRGRGHKSGRGWHFGRFGEFWKIFFVKKLSSFGTVALIVAVGTLDVPIAEPVGRNTAVVAFAAVAG